VRDDHSGLLIDRLAASIVDESLPLKDVEKELRGCVAEVAVKKRGLGKREIASRCGVTEKSIDNYLKEARQNPKSPEREIARLLQDSALSLEEIYEAVRPVLCHGRYFTLDDAKRTLEKLIRTGEAEEVPGKRYRGSHKPAIRVPLTVEAYRDLVDEKARDMDYIILSQKEVNEAELPPKKTQQFSRVVGDTNLVRIDFTVDVPEEELPEFYEKLSAEIARLTLKFEKKKGASRVRLVLGMRAVALLFAAVIGLVFMIPALRADGGAGAGIGRAGHDRDSWELDSRWSPRPGAGGKEDQDARDPARDKDPTVDSRGAGQDRRKLPPIFVRGDVTLDQRIDLSDVVALLVYLTQGTPISCDDAADANDDGTIDFVDPVRLIHYLFADERGAIAGVPGRGATDSTPDDLGCVALEN
jgi:Dockerin type I domain